MSKTFNVLSESQTKLDTTVYTYKMMPKRDVVN